MLTLHTNGSLKIWVHLVLAFCFVSCIHLDKVMRVSYPLFFMCLNPRVQVLYLSLSTVIQVCNPIPQVVLQHC